MIPTSATSFSSRRKRRSSPGSPFSAMRGAWLVGERKTQLPRPPRPPGAHEHLLAGFGQIGQQLTGISIVDHGADRDADQEVRPLRTGLILAAPVLAVGRAKVDLLVEKEQGVDLVIGDDVDVAALPTIAAAGPAPGHVGLAPEGHHPVAAVAGFDIDRRFIYQHAALSTIHPEMKNAKRKEPRPGQALYVLRFTSYVFNRQTDRLMIARSIPAKHGVVKGFAHSQAPSHTFLIQIQCRSNARGLHCRL